MYDICFFKMLCMIQFLEGHVRYFWMCYVATIPYLVMLDTLLFVFIFDLYLSICFFYIAYLTFLNQTYDN